MTGVSMNLPSDLTPVLLQGHVLDVLRSIPDRSVQCIVTSPPFWGLRAYHVCNCSQDYVRDDEESPLPKKAVSGDVRRKEPDPSCEWCGGTGKVRGVDEQVWGGDPAHAHQWVPTPPRRSRDANDAGGNINKGNRGASYDATGGASCSCGAWRGHLGLEPDPDLYVEHLMEVVRELRRVLRDDGVLWVEIGDSYIASPGKGGSGTPNGRNNRGENYSRQGYAALPPKSLALVPQRLALALQRDGWVVRQDNIWERPNPMPESVRDRSTRAHSVVYQLVKPPADYYYDQESVREVALGGHSWGVGAAGNKVGGNDSAIHAKESWYDSMTYQVPPGGGRNQRSVWRIPTKGYSGAHFAVFPEELPRRCILASTSERGSCRECGAPWERVVAVGYDVLRSSAIQDQPKRESRAGDPNSSYGFTVAAVARRKSDTVSWTPTCGHYPDPCDLCGKPWVRTKVRQAASTFNVRVRDAKSGRLGQESGLGGARASATEEEIVEYDDIGERVQEAEAKWPGCDCRRTTPCIVLDPFAGSGTTLAVAKALGRRSIGIEQNPAYVALARDRISEAVTETARHPSQRKLVEFETNVSAAGGA